MSTRSNFPLDPREFAGQRALVTGGTKGMGKAIVDRLRRAGATVITTARSVPGELEDGVHFVQADLGTAAGTTKVANEVLERFGGVDILVNNVGGSTAPGGGVLALTDEDWQRAFERQSVRRSAAGPGISAGDVEERLWRDHSYLLRSSARMPLFRSDSGVRGSEGGPDQLQQGPLQRGLGQKACASTPLRRDSLKRRRRRR